nr:hypothetical protein [Pandoravirus belohorizontensis]
MFSSFSCTSARTWRSGQRRRAIALFFRALWLNSARALDLRARRDARACGCWPCFFPLPALGTRARPSPFLCGCIGFFFPRPLPSGSDLIGAAFAVASFSFVARTAAAAPPGLPVLFFSSPFGTVLFFLLFLCCRVAAWAFWRQQQHTYIPKKMKKTCTKKPRTR